MTSDAETRAALDTAMDAIFDAAIEFNAAYDAAAQLNATYGATLVDAVAVAAFRDAYRQAADEMNRPASTGASCREHALYAHRTRNTGPARGRFRVDGTRAGE